MKSLPACVFNNHKIVVQGEVAAGICSYDEYFFSEITINAMSWFNTYLLPQ